MHNDLYTRMCFTWITCPHHYTYINVKYIFLKVESSLKQPIHPAYCGMVHACRSCNGPSHPLPGPTASRGLWLPSSCIPHRGQAILRKAGRNRGTDTSLFRHWQQHSIHKRWSTNKGCITRSFDMVSMLPCSFWNTCSSVESSRGFPARSSCTRRTDLHHIGATTCSLQQHPHPSCNLSMS